MAALICMPCLIAEARALFMFIFISPLIILKYIATEKIVTDQLPHDLRCGQIVVFRILHQSFFVFFRKTNSECCNFIHAFHSFHYYVQKGVIRMITVVQKMCGSYSEPRGERRGFFICSGCLIRECCFPLMQFSPAQQMQSKIKREKRESMRRSSRGYRIL